MKFKYVIIVALWLVLIALVATAGHLNTSGRCPGGTCTIGDSSTTSIELVTDDTSLTLGFSSGQFVVTGPGTGGVQFRGADAASPASTIYDTTGAGPITIGSPDVSTITLSNTGDIEIGEATTNTINMTTDGVGMTLDSTGTLTLTATDANTAVFTGADASVPSTTRYDTTDNGTIWIGSPDVAWVTVDTDGADLGVGDFGANAVSLYNGTAGAVTLSFHDYADTTDDDMAHALIASNCGTATSTNEECDLNMSITTAGANVEVLAMDPAGAIELGDAGTTTQVILTTDGVDMNLSGTNIMTLTATTTDAAIFRGADAAAEATTILDTTGAGTIQIGSVDVVGISLVTAGNTTLIPSETATFGAPNEMTADSTKLNQFVGIPRLNVTHTAALADGTAGVDVANPLLANCSAVVNGSEADDATNFVTGAASYQYTFAATAAESDGIDCDVAYPEAAGMDSVGFWFRTDTAIASGDLEIRLKDTEADEAQEDFPAVTVVDEWQWIEIDVNTDCAATCNGTDGFELVVTSQAPTNLNNVVINIDQIALWIATSEAAIGNIRVGGLIDVAHTLVAAGGANTPTQSVEWTHYFINYQSGADAIIPITDLQTYFATTLEALN